MRKYCPECMAYTAHGIYHGVEGCLVCLQLLYESRMAEATLEKQLVCSECGNTVYYTKEEEQVVCTCGKVLIDKDS